MERLDGVADTNRGPGDGRAKLGRYFSAGSMRLRCLHLARGRMGWISSWPPGGEDKQNGATRDLVTGINHRAQPDIERNFVEFRNND